MLLMLHNLSNLYYMFRTRAKMGLQFNVSRATTQAVDRGLFRIQNFTQTILPVENPLQFYQDLNCVITFIA